MKLSNFGCALIVLLAVALTCWLYGSLMLRVDRFIDMQECTLEHVKRENRDD